MLNERYRQSPFNNNLNTTMPKNFEVGLETTQEASKKQTQNFGSKLRKRLVPYTSAAFLGAAAILGTKQAEAQDRVPTEDPNKPGEPTIVLTPENVRINVRDIDGDILDVLNPQFQVNVLGRTENNERLLVSFKKNEDDSEFQVGFIANSALRLDVDQLSKIEEIDLNAPESWPNPNAEEVTGSDQEKQDPDPELEDETNEDEEEVTDLEDQDNNQIELSPYANLELYDVREIVDRLQIGELQPGFYAEKYRSAAIVVGTVNGIVEKIIEGQKYYYLNLKLDENNFTLVHIGQEGFRTSIRKLDIAETDYRYENHFVPEGSGILHPDRDYLIKNVEDVVEWLNNNPGAALYVDTYDELQVDADMDFIAGKNCDSECQARFRAMYDQNITPDLVQMVKNSPGSKLNVGSGQIIVGHIAIPEELPDIQ